MNRKGILEHVLLAVILFYLNTQALKAYVVLTRVDPLAAVERRPSPRSSFEQPAAPANVRTTRTGNVAMIWRVPGTDEVRGRILSGKDFETLKELARSKSEEELRAFLDAATNRPTSRVLADAQ